MRPVNRTRLERRHRNISQRAVETVTGIPQSVISLIETGRLIPTPKQLARLSAFFNVPPDDLLKNVATS